MDVRFWIWGEDNQAYGPADAHELGQWIAENRAGVGTWMAPVSPEEENTPPAQAPPAAPWQRLEESAFASVLPVVRLAIAPLWKRIIAYLLDSILLSGVTVFVLLIVGAVHPEFQEHYIAPAAVELREGNISNEAMAVLWIAQAIYWAYFHGRSGQTPGKRWLNLRVVTLVGQRLGWNRAILRALWTLLGGFFYGFGYLIAFWNPRRQALHDWLAGTVVVEENK